MKKKFSIEWHRAYSRGYVAGKRYMKNSNTSTNHYSAGWRDGQDSIIKMFEEIGFVMKKEKEE